MVQFKVGDVVALCASIRDLCYQGSQVYEVFDINISTGSCAINYANFGCLSPNGIQLDFQWTNTRSNTPTHGCDPTNNIKFLGSASTNSQGIASTTYTIVQEDLDLFNGNTVFDLRVCIRGTPYVYANAIGKVRNEISYRNGDYITIVPFEPPQPSHEIRFQLADNPYLSKIQENIVEISARLASALQLAGSVQYVRTEMNLQDNILTVFVRHTSLGGSLDNISMGTYQTGNTYPTGAIYSMGILDDIVLFAEMALAIITAIVTGYLVGIIVATGGWAAASISLLVITGCSVFLLGYFIYDINAQITQIEETIKVLQAKDDAGAARDAAKQKLDDIFDSQPYSKESCLTLITGYQAADLKYLDTLTKELTSMELDQIKQTYLNCTNDIINTFNASPGETADCNAARSGFTPCVNDMNVSTNTEFDTKYTDPNAPKEKGCGPDCDICIPLIEKCVSSGGSGLLTIGLVGIVLIGAMMSSKGGGGSTTTIRVQAEKGIKVDKEK